MRLHPLTAYYDQQRHVCKVMRDQLHFILLIELNSVNLSKIIYKIYIRCLPLLLEPVPAC